MQIVLDEMKRSLDSVPFEKLPIFLAALAGITAEVQMRMMRGGPAPVVREPEALLTVPEVAKQLKMSNYRVYEMARRGTLKAQYHGKSVRVAPSALADYVAKQAA